MKVFFFTFHPFFFTISVACNRQTQSRMSRQHFGITANYSSVSAAGDEPLIQTPTDSSPRRQYMNIYRTQIACLSSTPQCHGIDGAERAMIQQLSCVLQQTYESRPRRWSLWCTIRVSLTNDHLPPQHNSACWAPPSLTSNHTLRLAGADKLCLPLLFTYTVYIYSGSGT